MLLKQDTFFFELVGSRVFVHNVLKIMKRKALSKNAAQQLPQVLAGDKACYVLITCGQPSADGKMQVEMTYEGDACLAAYLIESAQGILDNQHEIS